MGKMSIILVFALILTGGTMLYNMQRVSLGADERLSVQQAENLAQKIAHAGLEHVMRVKIEAVTATIPPSNWASFTPIEEEYGGGTYSVEGQVGSCTGIENARLQPMLQENSMLSNHLMEVISTGTYEVPRGALFQDQTEISHQIKACYLRLDVSDVMPPAFEYAFLSNHEFEFNGGVEVHSYLGGDGNIHSNNTMYLGPNSVIHGHVTFSEEEGSEYKTTGKISEEEKFSDWGEADSVPMTAFDPYEYTGAWTTQGLPDDQALWDGDTVTIPTGSANSDEPFYWFVEGDLVLDGSTHLVIPDNAIIVVEGDMVVGGSANITSSGTTPDDHPEVDDWIAANTTSDGQSKLGFYVNGYRYNQDGELNEEITGGVDIHGSGSVVGNIYTNGNYTLSGGGQGSNLLGGVSALGTIEGRGGGGGRNFWYTSISEEIVIPGVLIPKELIALVAISEWGDPILRYGDN